MKETSHAVIIAALDIKELVSLCIYTISLSFEEAVVQKSVRKHIKWQNDLQNHY